MMGSMSEIAGDTSDEAWEFDRQTREKLGVKGLPGLGVSEKDDESFEHRVCRKCGNSEVRGTGGLTPRSARRAGPLARLLAI